MKEVMALKNIIVVGMGRFGKSLALTLIQKGCEVLVIDVDEEKIAAVSQEMTQAVVANATDEETMKALGVSNFDGAVVSIGTDIQANILATLILKELGVGYVLSKAISKLHSRLLEKVGADRIVFPESDMGIRVAQNLLSSNVIDYIELSPDYSLIEVVASPRFVGKSLSTLDLRRRFEVNVMAIKKKDGEIMVNPRAEDVIGEGDILIVIGHNGGLAKLRDF